MVRVRFAPSPTGYLHIGGARTALFNYLFAKKNNGKFILRIEDTDLERSTEESVKVILDSLKWLKINWDEGPEVGGEYGPYFQSQRLHIYKEYAEKLLKEGKAYKCYCTKEELEEQRKEAEKKKIPFKYSGKCRNSGEQNKPYTIRIKIDTEGETVFNDIIRGEVRFKNDVLDDFILVRQDGMPIYNFVVTIDDILMKITHIIRGEDHLSNTPKQIKIYQALGINPPEFAHIPLILGPDRSRLSKRHGATSVGEYREKGFLPEAFVNYLALLGWSPDSEENIFSYQQLIEKFTLERVHKSGAMFDNNKLLWLNGVYIREKIGFEEYFDKCVFYLKKSGLINDEFVEKNKEYIIKVISLEREKIKVFSEISETMDYFFKDEIEIKEDGKKIIDENKEIVKNILLDFYKIVSETGVEKIKVEESLKEEIKKYNIKPKIFMHIIRVALTGKTVGAGLFDIVETLGREKVLKRLQKFL